MQPILLTSKDQLCRHLGAAFAIAALFAAVCGSASAQTVAAQVTVVPGATTPPSPPWCSPPQGGYVVCVDREPITTPGSSGDDVAIKWKLNSSGWTFAKNKGIDVKNKKNWKVKEDSSTEYTATNKKENLQYKYEINVTNGANALTWDPTIEN